MFLTISVKEDGQAVFIYGSFFDIHSDINEIRHRIIQAIRRGTVDAGSAEDGKMPPRQIWPDGEIYTEIVPCFFDRII